jgi:hypothetical protein
MLDHYMVGEKLTEQLIELSHLQPVYDGFQQVLLPVFLFQQFDDVVLLHILYHHQYQQY